MCNKKISEPPANTSYFKYYIKPVYIALGCYMGDIVFGNIVEIFQYSESKVELALSKPSMSDLCMAFSLDLSL
jgi:hypothetical protein